MANIFDNWRAAWASVLDETDENYPHHIPQPDQAAFMDKHLGTGPVIMYFDELAAPDPLGNVHDTLTTNKPALDEKDILLAYNNGVFVNFSNNVGDGGVWATFVKQ